MITEDNFKKVLEDALYYTKVRNQYLKKYVEYDCEMIVDYKERYFLLEQEQILKMIFLLRNSEQERGVCFMLLLQEQEKAHA